jgi:hypothetical protein
LKRNTKEAKHQEKGDEKGKVRRKNQRNNQKHNQTGETKRKNEKNPTLVCTRLCFLSILLLVQQHNDNESE